MFPASSRSSSVSSGSIRSRPTGPPLAIGRPDPQSKFKILQKKSSCTLQR
jgi:hypothetical protein